MELWTFPEALSGGKTSLDSAAGDGTYHQTYAGNFLFWVSSFPSCEYLGTFFEPPEQSQEYIEQ